MPREFNYQRARNAPAVTLLDFLTTKFKYHTREEWAECISRKGWLLVGGTKTTDPNLVLPQRTTIGFDVPAEAEPDVDGRMSLVHCDQHIVVVSKSGNMPVAEGGRYSKRTLIRIAPRIFAEQLASCVTASNSASTAACCLYAVHRLDKETSGIVVMARSIEATQNLGLQFSRSAGAADDSEKGEEALGQRRDRSAAAAAAAAANGEMQNEDQQQISTVAAASAVAATAASSSDASMIEKEYFAIVLGKLEAPQDVQLRIGFEHEVLSPEALAKLNRKRPKMRMAAVVSEQARDDYGKQHQVGKSARTVITPVGYSKRGEMTAVRVRLYTGRTHQIRIHCAAIGHPLVGEKLYVAGGGSVDCDTFLERARGNLKVLQALLPSGSSSAATAAAAAEKDRQICSDRHLLHAAMLKISHPTTKAEMVFRSNPWPSFLEACPQLGEFFEPPPLKN